MKINLLMNSPNTLSDFVNVDALDMSAGKKYSALDDLSSICEKGEASEIRAADILDYFSWRAVPAVLGHWASRLSFGGTLTISGIDGRTLIRKIDGKVLDWDNANAYLFGNQVQPYEFKKSLLNPDIILNILKSIGLKIEEVNLQDGYFTIKAKRPQ